MGSDISPPPRRRKLEQTNLRDQSISTMGFNSHPAQSVSPSTTVSPNLLRIFSWNVNGIGPFLQKPITSFFTPRLGPSPPSSASTSQLGTPPSSLRAFLGRHHFPALLCLQEVKINPKDEPTKRALERAANVDGPSNNGPGYTAHYCLPRDKFNAKGFGGKVYGVATFIRDDFLAQHVSVTKEVSWDSEGRVLITELKPKSNNIFNATTTSPSPTSSSSTSTSSLAIINGYWPNGTTNPYRDPSTGTTTGTRHDRKRAFHGLMLAECSAYEARGWMVVLVGDVNIARGPLDGHPGIRLGDEHVRNRADFNAKFCDGGMRGVDVWRWLRGGERKYTYHGRGVEWGSSCDRVDLIVVSRALVDVPGLLVNCDILDTREERGHSDHVPLYVSLDLGKLQ